MDLDLNRGFKLRRSFSNLNLACINICIENRKNLHMRLPVGVSNFQKLIKGEYQFIDKSLFIKEIIDDGAEVILITRPRRFGKTLNLSMLYYFLQLDLFQAGIQFSFPQADNQSGDLFKYLAISKETEFCVRHQQQYPVIFITFKGVKQTNYADAYDFILDLVSDLYEEHSYLLDDGMLSAREKANFTRILEREASPAQISKSIKSLAQYLDRKFNKKTIILIDEYDTPIQEAYLHSYYTEMVALMRGILGEALKDNSYLTKAVLTGISRVSQESMFSGLNNIKVYSLLNEQYGQYFGFTEAEVKELIAKFDGTRSGDTNPGVKVELEAIKYWYNGYQIGRYVLYNPWSIINCLANEGILALYWVNTSSNELLTRLLSSANAYIKQQLEKLMQGKVIEQPLAEDLVFLQINTREEALWSLLLYAGYLKILSSELKGNRLMAKLAIPNKEVSFVYDRIVEAWFNEAVSLESYDKFVHSLVSGDLVSFKQHLASYILKTGSYFDFNQHTAEQVFHVFILGLVVGLRDNYYIYSNREAGFGRFDVILLPHDKQRQGIILEFKTLESVNVSTSGSANASTAESANVAKVAEIDKLLKAKAEAVLEQIKAKQYLEVFKQHQVQQVLAIGLAFCGKKVELAYDRITLNLDLGVD